MAKSGKQAVSPEKALLAQDPHAVREPRANNLEMAIGHEVRTYRKKLGITVADLAQATGMSIGMLSKIENGNISPSLTTLQALSKALGVPLTAFFRGFEEPNSASFVKAGEGGQSRTSRDPRRPPLQSAGAHREQHVRCDRRALSDHPQRFLGYLPDLSARGHGVPLHAKRRGRVPAWGPALPYGGRRQPVLRRRCPAWP